MDNLQIGTLFFGILPLIAFVILDSFLGLKKALMATGIFALCEAVFTIYYFGELDYISAFSLFLVLIFCYVSLKKKDDFYIKMQPVVLSIVISVILITTYITDRPFLLEFSLKYQDFLPQNFKAMLARNDFQNLLTISTLTLGVAHLGHGVLVYWSAIRLNNWWWIAMRGIGYYLFMALGLLSARLYI
ncbi:MAG: hypothetical protein ACO2ZP_03910 [Bacteriovoracaceae bacterium]